MSSVRYRWLQKFIVIQHVDFVINIGGEVFVEAVGHAQVDVVHQILIDPRPSRSLPLSKPMPGKDADRSRTGTVQPLQSSESGWRYQITVWRHVAGFRIHHRQINAVGIVFRANGPGFSFFTASSVL
jgi:hypothetical protein